MTLVSMEGGTEEERAELREARPSPFRLSLPEFFLTFVFKEGPTSKEDLRAAAHEAGYFGDEASAGRVTHTTLLNLEKNGKLLKLEDGDYVSPSRSSMLSIPDLSPEIDSASGGVFS